MLFDRILIKITKINSIYIYGNLFKCTDELILDNNIIFLSYHYSNTTYKHYKNDISDETIRIKISDFILYKIINDTDLNDIYFINDEITYNYHDSNFYKNKNYIIMKNRIFKLLYSMSYGPMSNIDNSYYLKYRKDMLNDYFRNIKLDEVDIKKICDELNIQYTNYTDNFYTIYNNLFNEYKTLNAIV